MNIFQPVLPILNTVSACPPGEAIKFPFTPHPLLIAFLLHQGGQAGPHLLISFQKDLLLKIQKAIGFFEPEQTVFFFKTKSQEPEGVLKLSCQESALRLKILARAQKASPVDIFMAEPQSLMERLPSPRTLQKQYIPLQRGQNLSPNFPLLLKKVGYESRDRVEQMGEFSMRGAVCDIFCPLNGPIRLDLMGHEVEQIRLFDVQTQARLQEIKSLDIVPAKEAILKETPSSSFGFLHYIPSPLVWLLEEPATMQNHLHEWKQNQKDFLKKQKEGGLNSRAFEDLYLPDWRVKKTKKIIFEPASPFLNQTGSGQVLPFEKEATFRDSFSYTETFFKNPDWPQKIKEQRKKGMLVFIFAGRERTQKALKEALEKEGMRVKDEQAFFDMQMEQEKSFVTLHLIQSFNSESLVWMEKNLIFLKADSFIGSRQKHISWPETQGVNFSFADIQKGDLMVHRQYGIGCFKGLEIFNFGTKENEFLVLEYKGEEKLYVPVYALHQVQKYMHASINEGQKWLDKLGGSKWRTTKERVQKRIKNMSLELMNLYHLRANMERKRFSSPGLDFEKFEEAFPFAETPDQKKAIQDVIQDLTKKDIPADRLICGDTGFGKTEVAMRAVFKVIEDGFQACLMAPTTLLSFQHFETFKNRFQNWPISIRLLNRFTPAQRRKKLIKELKEGHVDILIGTHRILSRDIHFKKPGLLIIDEEHLFGVQSKEKIKNWYSHIDTLSLSATPIPRSFSMSLSGLRDMSLILTPPLNRKAVKTFISPFNETLIKKAILKELERKGQIIFIHNRISSIYEAERKLKALLPSVRIRVAHGKMKNMQEEIVLDFFQRKFDLLLCTTIVESGMDFQRAGTLFIDRAEQFGLSELHQLRGRVGRSERESYCYMLVEERKKLSHVALERLRIIQENNQPGSGWVIAQYDLELRGAGELMGREQSGFLQEVGYELYFEFLRESLSSLKNETPEAGAPEPDLKFKCPAFIPASYIPHEKTRLIFYKKLALASSEKEIEGIKRELEDFAGPLPESAENLIWLSHLRRLAKKWHIRELSHRPPFLYISFAESTPIEMTEIVKWIEQGVGTWQDKETLKFHLPTDTLAGVVQFLNKLRAV